MTKNRQLVNTFLQLPYDIRRMVAAQMELVSRDETFVDVDSFHIEFLKRVSKADRVEELRLRLNSKELRC